MMTGEETVTAGSRQGEHNARCYQSFFVDFARKQNVVACLPTGSGKTFIAVQLTKEFLPDSIEKGKKIIMLEPTVALTKQQFQYFFSHLPDVNTSEEKDMHTVEYLTGDRDVDRWSGNNWETFFSRCHVIVMTPQILVIALLHSYMSFNQISLLILDECHHCEGGHPMAQIMEKYREEKARGRPVPRVLGLTATIISGQKKPGAVASQVEEMERALCAKAATYREYEQVLKYSTNATVEYIHISPKLSQYYQWSSATLIITRSLLEFKALVATQDKSLFQKDRSKEVNHPSLLSKEQLYATKKRGELKKFDAVVMDVLKIYDELGPYAARYAAINKRVFVQSKNMEKFEFPIVEQFYNLLDAALKSFVDECDKLIEAVQNKEERLTRFITQKLEKMLTILDKYRPEPNANVDEKNVFCGIIFVERRLAAQVVSWYLKDLSEIDRWSFIRCGFVMGCSNNELDAKEKQISPEEQARVLRDFRNGNYNLLVATSVVEEGLDVPICSLIVRFDTIKTYPSYIQSMGRARGARSKFFAFVETDKEKESYEKFHEFNAQLSSHLQRNAVHPDGDDDEDKYLVVDRKMIPDFAPYGQGTTPCITSSRCLDLVEQYCQTLETDRFASFEPIAWHQNVGGDMTGSERFKAYIQFPSNSVIREVVEGDIFPCKEIAKKSVFLKACELLYLRGALSRERLLPIPRRLRIPLLNKLMKESPGWKVLLEAEKKIEINKLKSQVGTKSQSQQYKKKIPDCLNAVHEGERERKFIIFKIQLEVEKDVEPEGRARGRLNFFGLENKSGPSFGLLVEADLDLATIIPKFSLLLKDTLYFTVALTKVKFINEAESPNNWNEVAFSQAEKFQEYIFGDVLSLKNAILKVSTEKSPILLLPLRQNEHNEFWVSWPVIKKVVDDPSSSTRGAPTVPDERSRRSFKFAPSNYDDDTLVFPWYKPQMELYAVGGIIRNSSIFAPHPSIQNMNIANYFLKQYPQINFIQDQQQVLIKGHPIRQHHPEALNFFNPPAKRPAQAKRKQVYEPEIIVPELVTVHPLPLSLYLQSKFLPSILHRISRFLLAKEIQTQVCGSASSTLAFGASPLGFGLKSHLSNLLVTVTGYEEEKKYLRMVKEARDAPENITSLMKKLHIGIREEIEQEQGQGESDEMAEQSMVHVGQKRKPGAVTLGQGDKIGVQSDFDTYGGDHLNKIQKIQTQTCGSGDSTNEASLSGLKSHLSNSLGMLTSYGEENSKAVDSPEAVTILMKKLSIESNEMTKQKLNFIHPSEYKSEDKLKIVAQTIKANRAQARKSRALTLASGLGDGVVVPNDWNTYGGKHLIKIHKLVDIDKCTNLKKYDQQSTSSSSSFSSPSLFSLMQAITLKNSRDFLSLERLETLGDSFLKFVVIKFIFTNFPQLDEGRMTELKSFLVSNAHLYGLGEKNLNLGEYLAGGIFVPDSAWLPPSFTVEDRLMEAAARNNVNEDIFMDENQEALLSLSDGAFDQFIQMRKPLMGQIMKAKKQSGNKDAKLKPDNIGYKFARLSDKDLADSVEALIGAFYLSSGFSAAYKFLDKLGLKGPANGNLRNDESPEPVEWIPIQHCPEPTVDFIESSSTSVNQFLPAYKALEHLIGYTFKEPWLLVQAFSHPCYMLNRVTPAYERLEFIGDGILDFLITDHVFQLGHLTPGQLTDIRSALVNNVTFGSLAVRFGLHKYILHSSKALQEAIDGFVRYQEEHEHRVTGQFTLMTDYECVLVRDIEMPKILGDIWESLAGAIYVDSGMSLDSVWRVFYRLMRNEIDLFSKNPPKSPVRRLVEKFPSVNHLFIDVTKEWRLVANPELTYIQVNLSDPQSKIGAGSGVPPIVGAGKSKKSAKLAVAKYAMKKLDEISARGSH